MEDISVIKYNSSYFDVWNDFVVKSKNATFLFHRDFMDYHSDRFEDYSLLVYKNNKLIAILPACVDDNGISSHSGLTYGGVLCEASVRLETFLNVFKSILSFLYSKGIQYLEIKNIPYIYNRYIADELEYVMYLTEAELIRRDALSVIDLSNKNKYSYGRKSEIKKAVKNNLQIVEMDDCTPFWNQVLIPNLWDKYKTSPVHTLEEINKLKALFPNNIRQFNVYSKDILIGGATVFVSDNVAHMQYISGNEKYNVLGGLDLLHSHLIENVFNDKKFFDFGISNEKKGNNINKGLLFWKESFGARTVIQNFYKIKTENYNKLRDIWI